MGREQDEQLFERYRIEGDMDAFAELVENHRSRLFGYLLKMTRNGTEAEEAFQDVWIRVVNKAELFRGGNFGGWLLRMAHNLVIDRARRRKPVVSLEAGEDEGHALLDRMADPLAAESWLSPAADELGNAIAAAVAKLPAEQREVFLLRTDEGMEFKHIAKLQGTSINTALARMHYALGKLRTQLRGHYEEWR